ncbi:hypothetical protein PGH07_07870 [Sulfurovum sp. zt1-1]|uniref:Uncharacterized protein n=1 Tax=Sulfurovum zhangzhouensis TaxID=3019067 RepID=A0ABT7QZY6_9BACT|nr:hypothetical protein [Sulfurovum zhangzhouensis]MDM5272094.1 hypothetical protein [Sulfurovum zhangzhouensis]
MNIHYKNYPTDYIDDLQSQGKRHKARCFWEYYNDVQNKAVNSIGFYCKSWGRDKPESKGTVHKWIIEFRDEIQRFYDAHILLNHQHYSYIKNQSERQVNDLETFESLQSTNIPSVDKIECTASERQVNKALNISNIKNNARALYDGFYFIYRQFNRYAGNKLEGMESFVRVDDVSHKSLSVAAIFYLKDHNVDRKVGVKKFLDNKVYLNYLDLKISVFFQGKWMDGIYDPDKEIFMTGDDSYSLPATTLADKFGKDEIKFLKEVA